MDENSYNKKGRVPPGLILLEDYFVSEILDVNIFRAFFILEIS